jgi:hypothetical protein
VLTDGQEVLRARGNDDGQDARAGSAGESGNTGNVLSCWVGSQERCNPHKER